jgi:hypothetical protein
MGYPLSPCTNCPTQTDHNKTIPTVEYEKISNAKFSPQRIDHKPTTICPCARNEVALGNWKEKKRKVWARGNLCKVAYPLCAKRLILRLPANSGFCPCKKRDGCSWNKNPSKRLVQYVGILAICQMTDGARTWLWRPWVLPACLPACLLLEISWQKGRQAGR